MERSPFAPHLHTVCVCSQVVRDQWALGRVVCNLWVMSDVLFSTSSIINLLAISFDRCARVPAKLGTSPSLPACPPVRPQPEPLQLHSSVYSHIYECALEYMYCCKRPLEATLCPERERSPADWDAEDEMWTTLT